MKKKTKTKTKRNAMLLDFGTDKDLKTRLFAYAKSQERSASYVIRHAVADYLEQHSK